MRESVLKRIAGALPLAGLALSLVALCGAASADGGPPVARAVETDEPIKLDGKLDEGIWSRAPAQSGIYPLGRRKRAPQEVDFRIVYDREALYLGARCAESEMELISIRGDERDKGAICADDSIELLIVPGNGYYYQFAINVAGYFYDGRREARAGGLTPQEMSDGLFWDGAWEGAVHKGADFWSVELRIPFAALDAGSGFGDVWRMNFARTEARSGYGCWSPTERGYHDLPNYGYLEGLRLPQYEVVADVAALEAPAFFVGANKARLNIPVKGGEGRTFELRSSLRQWERGLLPERVARAGGLRAVSGMVPVVLDVLVEQPGVMHEYVFELADEETGEPFVSKMFLFRAPAPIEASAPWTVFFDGDRRAAIGALVKLAEGAESGELELRVTRGGGERVLYTAREKVKGGGFRELVIPLRKLKKPGAYNATVVLRMANAEFRDDVSFYKMAGAMP